MANALYPRAKQGFISGELNLTTAGAAQTKASLIDGADYTYGAAHSSYATDVVAAAKVATSANLGTLSVTGPGGSTPGCFDSADFSWTAVTGDPCEIIILWADAPTTPVADPLIAYYDTGITGMSPSVTPNGGDINVTVNAAGWFAL